MNRRVVRAAIFAITSVVLFYSCSKHGEALDPCAGKTISLTASTTDAVGTTNNGTITVAATGSSGFTYSINDGAYGTSNVFSNLAPGSYSIVAKDEEGCTGQASFTVNSADACAGKNFVFTPNSAGADKCAGDGQLTVNVTGGTGFQYKLDGGNYQANNVFNNVAAGAHTVYAKDAAGCERAASVTVAEKPAGTLFTAVKNLMVAKCASCHMNGNSDGGVNFDTDCNIVASRANIKVQAVDQGTMPEGGPELAKADKDKITAWINAGGKHSN